MEPPPIKNPDPFLTHQLKSFSWAADGIWYSFKKGTHFKIHIVLAIFAIFLGFLLKISSTEWLVLILIISGVLSAEAMNTAIEETCELLHPELHPRARLAKHCGAAAVFIISIAAVVIAAVIFLPKL